MTKKRTTTKIGRDAKSGEFIPVKETNKQPATTVRLADGRILYAPSSGGKVSRSAIKKAVRGTVSERRSRAAG